ncbi:hypothetical protein Hanom_Chr07g00639811 [Helianthus anomalus]
MSKRIIIINIKSEFIMQQLKQTKTKETGRINPNALLPNAPDRYPMIPSNPSLQNLQQQPPRSPKISKIRSKSCIFVSPRSTAGSIIK